MKAIIAICAITILTGAPVYPQVPAPAPCTPTAVTASGHPNICAKADFGVVSACAGTGVTIPNQSTGATSSTWTLPGGTPSSSTAVSPSVVWAGAGSFPVKLCINGGTAAPLCITKTIIVNAAPAVPILTGPTTSCQNPATYCVTNPQAGVSYSWFATGGTVNPASGTCTTVNWTSAGVIAVTATNKAGCKSSRRMEVAGCTTHNPCCDKPQFKIDSWSMPLAGGNYVFTPVLTTVGPVKRVVIDVISADISYSSPACGTAHTFLPSISGLHPVSGFGSWQPVANSTEAVWYASTGVPLNLVAFPIDLALPPHSGACSDTVHFCVKYTVTNGECRTCEIVQCYTFTRKLNIDTPAENNNNPLPN
ncbi:MAG: hypothetical protein JWO97_1517 [Acidobacteria bacterium]|nr:hypothetical protein [Acidobacteriota bacterium]